MMRPDAKVEKSLSLPQARRLPKIHRRPRRSGRTGHQGRGVFPGAFRVPQQASKPSEDFVLGAQRLLPLAEAPGVRAFQNIAGLFG